ncbi:17.6 kDa class I heat shock protein 2 [Geodia barretti]|nr:17.6 kDa class I heat shock protein 2 [Geodia barretti]
MREGRSGSFHRSLRLPDTVDQDRAEPRYEHGVLTVTLPKAEAKRAKEFPVQVIEGPAAIEGS